MRTMKGPGIFLSQFIGAEAPFNSLDGLAEWAAGKGYKAVQIPCNHPHIFDVEKAAESRAYCDDITAAGRTRAGYQRAVDPSGRAARGGESGLQRGV